jgi:hypothetical protein
MITKSGLLQFFSQCCNRLIFNRTNDISLGFIRLVLRVLKGFVESPTEWDGPVHRTEWLQQFANLAMNSVVRMSEMRLISIEWELTLIARLLELTLLLYSLKETFGLQMQISNSDFTHLKQSIQKLKGMDGTTVQDEYDLDSLFKTMEAPHAVYECQRLLEEMDQYLL